MADQNPYIPDHLIFQEILPRLPAKSLLEFKSVASEWNSIISSVEFAKTHLLFHSHISSASVLTHENADLPLEAVEFDGNRILDSNRYGLIIKGRYILVSSCNGLILLISCDHQSYDNFAQFPFHLPLLDFAYVVYNPVLGVDHFVEVPHPNELPLSDKTNFNYNFGFGYVRSRDDYCIVAIHSPCSSEMFVYVYSLRSQQWKTVTGNVAEEQQVSPMVFRKLWLLEIATLVGETLHWNISLCNNGHRIHRVLAFDLDSHQLRLMRLPRDNFGGYSGLCCLNGCLCAWATNQKNGVAEMWMMREYGRQNTWNRLFSIRRNTVFCNKFIGSIKPEMALVFANQDELKLVDFSRDPPILSNAVLRGKWEAVSYVSSLVSVFALLSEEPEPRE